jgi:hypothetical protein
MNNIEKSAIVIDNLAELMNGCIQEYKNENQKNIDNMSSNEDYLYIRDQIAVKINTELNKWETAALPALGGDTPRLYFEKLTNLVDFIDIIDLMVQKDVLIISDSFYLSVEKLKINDLEELINLIESIQIDESNSLDSKQKAIVILAGYTKSNLFLPGISRIFIELNEEKSDRLSFDHIIDAFTSIGRPSIESLISIVEEIDGLHTEGFKSELAILTLAGIARDYKNEEIYMFIKKCFRESDRKIIVASAFSIYGDGRAIPAIRGHVSKNIDNITPGEYFEFNKAVTELGGDMSDFDEYFDDYNDDEYEDEDYDQM